MCVILQRCRFLHNPKTGGTWVRQALGASCRPFANTEFKHPGLNEAPGRGLFTVAFVRHPWSWWRSYWLFKRTHGWDFNNHVDIACMDNVFERYMVNVADKFPGHCTSVFQQFVGYDATEIEYVGRFESLVDNLVAALELAGEPFDEQHLRDTAVVNAGDYNLFSTHCSVEVRQRVLDAEHNIMARFNYSADS
jgi:hypothetical protein